MCIAARLIWQLVVHSCVIFVIFLISRWDGKNNCFLAGVPLLPPPSRVVSVRNSLPLPFRTPATQATKGIMIVFVTNGLQIRCIPNGSLELSQSKLRRTCLLRRSLEKRNINLKKTKTSANVGSI